MQKDYIVYHSSLVNSPYDVQKLLRSFNYNSEKNGETLRSANEALKLKTSHCLEACFIASALLEKHGFDPLVLSLESVDCLDHVVYLFKQHGKWGSIGHSRDEGLFGRNAIFDSPREVAKSYIDPYVDLSGRIKAYAVCNLNEVKSDWRYSKRNVWKTEQFLIDYPHKKLNCSNTHYKKLLERYKSGLKPVSQSYWL